MNLLDKAMYLFIVFFFVIQNNFWLTNKLAINEGLGLGRYRAVILVVMIFIGLILLLAKALSSNNFFSIKINSVEIIALAILLFMIGIHIIRDFFIYDQVDFIGVAPLIECIFFGVYFFLVVRKPILINETHVAIFSFFIFSNISLELFYYFKDILSGISYGPFRANIAGLVVNRNPSFFYPIFAFAILRFSSLKFYFRISYTIIFFIYVLTLFYRTLYVALLFPFLYDLLRYGGKISIIGTFRFIMLLCVMLIGILFIDTIIESQFDFSIVKAFTGRFSSTFTDYSNDDAQKDRVNQIPDMLYVIAINPLGIGFSGLVLDAEVYNYAFYFLHPILYLGWSVLFVYWILYKKIYMIFKKARINLKDRILFFCILYFFLILTFFPYMNYFTFLSILICLFQLSSIEIQKGNTPFLKL